MAETYGQRKLVQIKVGHLVPGMELAHDLLSTDGKILIAAGTVFSGHTIAKLKNWHIPVVNICSEATVNPLVSGDVEKFVHSYNKSVSAVQQAFAQMRTTQELPLETFTATAGELSANLKTAGNIIDRLYDLPPCDDATFQHSVNVGVIAALIATWMDYPQEIVNAISLAGLLHDIGKSLLPPELLHRPHLLSPQDYAHYQRHVNGGYELVRNVVELSSSIKAGVGQHHERNDRSGNPLRLPAEKIHPYAKIVAVADIYDEALTVNRDPSVLYSPYSGLEKVNNEKHRADPEICLRFIDRMLNYLSGNEVVLSDGRQGRVVYLNQAQPSRSIVQLQSGAILDLADDPDLHIHYVVR